MAAPSAEIFRTTQLMTEPPDDTYAGSLISVRGYFRFSSIDGGPDCQLWAIVAANIKQIRPDRIHPGVAVLHKVTTQPSPRRETVGFFTILHDELKGRAAAAG
jgi:hypothetical protein